MIAYNLRGVRNSAVASQPCPSGHITADKMLRYAMLKLPSATSLIRKTLYEIPNPAKKEMKVW
jgi:hypothetical protein